LPGGYEAYERLRRSASTAVKPKPAKKASAKTAGGRSASTIRHQLTLAEKEMAAVEKRRNALEAELEAVATSGDHSRMSELGSKLNDVLAQVGELEERWLSLSEELEGV